MDGDGRHLKPGRIEVTDSQLILYQKGNIVVKWPLKSLRRYGFDSEVFSFECGRRCSTGPGVYAFKCKRAQALFTILQECINNSGGGGGGGAGTSPSMPSIEDQISLAAGGDRMPSMQSPPPVPNGPLQNVTGGSCPTVDSSGYLEPINANSYLHYPTVSRSTSTAGSPGGYVCIHSSGNNMDWSGVASSLPNCCSLNACGGRSIGTSSSAHQYINAEVIEQAAACSNRMCVVHHYVNSSVISTEVSHRCCMPPKCCSEQNENTYINSPMVTLSPGHLPCSGSCCAVSCTNCVDMNTNYAKLDDLLKQEQSAKKHKEQPFYVNVKPDAATAQSGSSTSSKCVSGRSTPTEALSRSGTLTSPTSPLSTKVLSAHGYANLSNRTSLEDALDKEEDQVNYAVLDLDQNDVVMSPVSVPNNFSREHSLVNSPVRSPEGYAQIDFDKTVALSISANPCLFNDESIRKTRHNADKPCSSMSA